MRHGRACLLLVIPLVAGHVSAPLRTVVAAALRSEPAHRRTRTLQANEVLRDVQRQRMYRRAGLGLGSALLAGGVGVGITAGVLPREATLATLWSASIGVAALWGAYTLSFDEHRLPFGPVEPGESAPGMGRGLFATADIPKVWLCPAELRPTRRMSPAARPSSGHIPL